MNDDQVVAATRAWVERAVIGLGLCPFAAPAQQRGAIRFTVSAATSADALVADLERALRELIATDPEEVETTLLIHPQVFDDFLAFNDFLDVAEALLQALDLEGVVQVASFHPQYQFEGTEHDDIGNATNRSPFPTLHLLREESITRALENWNDDPAAIFERNIETLRRLGANGWTELAQSFVPREAKH